LDGARDQDTGSQLQPGKEHEESEQSHGEAVEKLFAKAEISGWPFVPTEITDALIVMMCADSETGETRAIALSLSE